MNKAVLKNQRATASSLTYELTGKKLTHLRSGRPFVSRSMDVSVSHKGPVVGVSVVPAPYRIGIDIEWLGERLSTKLFFGSVITKEELPVFKNFCREAGFSPSSGVAVFWSIKESFFKCLDHDLKPGKIGVLGISREGEIQLGLSDEIKNVMKKRNLELCSVKAAFDGEYVYLETIMRWFKKK